MIRPWGISKIAAAIMRLMALGIELIPAAAETDQISAANQTRARADGQSKPSLPRARASRDVGTLPDYPDNCPGRRVVVGPHWHDASGKDRDYLFRREVGRDYMRRLVHYRNTRRVRTILGAARWK